MDENKESPRRPFLALQNEPLDIASGSGRGLFVEWFIKNLAAEHAMEAGRLEEAEVLKAQADELKQVLDAAERRQQSFNAPGRQRLRVISEEDDAREDANISPSTGTGTAVPEKFLADVLLERIAQSRDRIHMDPRYLAFKEAADVQAQAREAEQNGDPERARELEAQARLLLERAKVRWMNSDPERRRRLARRILSVKDGGGGEGG